MAGGDENQAAKKKSAKGQKRVRSPDKPPVIDVIDIQQLPKKLKTSENVDIQGMLGKGKVIKGGSLETDSAMVPVAASEPVVCSSPVGIPMDVQFARSDNTTNNQLDEIGVSSNQLHFYEVARAYLLFPAPNEHDDIFLSYLQAEIKKRTGDWLETDVLKATWKKIPDSEIDDLFDKIDKDLENPSFIGWFTIGDVYIDPTEDRYIEQTVSKKSKHEAFIDISCWFKEKGMQIRPFDIFKYYTKNFKQPVVVAAAASSTANKGVKGQQKTLRHIKVDNELCYLLRTGPPVFPANVMQADNNNKSNVRYVPNVLPPQIFKSTTFFLFVSKQDWVVYSDLFQLEYLIKVFGGKVIPDEAQLEETKKKVVGVVVGNNFTAAQNFCNETGVTLYCPFYIFKCVDRAKCLKRTEKYIAFEKEEQKKFTGKK